MEKVRQTDRERFESLMGNADKWASIEDLVSLCDDAGYWSDEFYAQAQGSAKKSMVRRLIRTLKDDTDFPVWASVETTNEDGKNVRVYKQETLFDVDDYRQVVSYHSDRSSYHATVAKEYAKRCKVRFNKQLKIDL